MYIGTTPQQKLAVIKHIHKRANIIGLIFGGLGVLSGVSAFGLFFDIVAMFGRFGYGFIIADRFTLVMGALIYARCFSWIYYWLKSKFDIETMYAMVILLNPVKEEQQIKITDEGGVTMVPTMVLSVPALIVGTIVMTIGFWFGLYLAIKYTIMEFRLKRQV